jgi:uncharacterized coiled-coil protein SlyX
MRTEINVLTGKVTEHEDASVTWEVPVEIVQTKPTVEQLQAQLATIAAQLQELQGTV